MYRCNIINVGTNYECIVSQQVLFKYYSRIGLPSISNEQMHNVSHYLNTYALSKQVLAHF